METSPTFPETFGPCDWSLWTTSGSRFGNLYIKGSQSVCHGSQGATKPNQGHDGILFTEPVLVVWASVLLHLHLHPVPYTALPGPPPLIPLKGAMSRKSLGNTVLCKYHRNNFPCSLLSLQQCKSFWAYMDYRYPHIRETLPPPQRQVFFKIP